MHTLRTTTIAAVILLATTGCTALTGPSCTDYRNATDTEQQQMALDWVVFNGLAPAGSSVTEEEELVGYGMRRLDQGCATSAGYTRLHMFRMP